MVLRSMKYASQKILFINGGTKKFGQDFRAACVESGSECTSIRTLYTAFCVEKNRIDVFVNGAHVPMETFDQAFLRVRGKTPHTASLLVKLLVNAGVPVNDPISEEHTQSTEKITQMVLLAQAGIPVPKSWIFSKASLKANTEIILPSLSYPCVLKTNGSQGRAVWKIDSQETLLDMVASITDELMIVQEYIPNTFDIRALFFFSESLGAIERAATDGFYNNISHGGTAHTIDLTQEELSLGQRACQVTGIDFGGVDIVRTKNGPVIFEVNAGPQVYGFESATRLSVGKEVARRLMGQIHKKVSTNQLES